MDGNNLLLAILLSVIVLVSWQYFFALPEMKRENALHAPTAHERISTNARAADALIGHAAASSTQEDRLRIETPTIDGSLLLKGARFDDLRLKEFHVATDPKSPEITLFEPSRSGHPYFATFGWQASADAKVAMPDQNSVWRPVSRTALSPAHPVLLEWDNGQGLVFRRRIGVDQNYMLTVEDSVQNNSARPMTLYPYAAIIRKGAPNVRNSWYVHEGFIGIADNRLKKASYKDFDKDDVPADTFASTGGWLGITDQYWMAALIPPQQDQFDGTFQASSDGSSDKTYQAAYELSGRLLNPHSEIRVEHRLFAGAKVYEILRSYEGGQGVPALTQAIDWGWFSILTKPLFLLLDWFNHIVGNFGLAIMLLTVAMKGLFFPLANLSFKSSARMKAIQPHVKDIQERFSADKVRQQKEIMELYRREKVKPFAFGCLPMAVQLPVFLSLLTVLYATIEMYHAPFFGWVHDLSAPDPTSILNLFGLLPYHVPHLLPAFLSIGLWPILWGVTQWIQSFLVVTSPDPVQAKMTTAMPFVLVFLYAGLPVGLVIYYTWSNFLTILQQCLFMRLHRVPTDGGSTHK